MPINVNEKEKIAHLNAERLLGLGQKEGSRAGLRAA
jgi:predicted TIM-barrel fold metal-dependent hydrolase